MFEGDGEVKTQKQVSMNRRRYENRYLRNDAAKKTKGINKCARKRGNF